MRFWHTRLQIIFSRLPVYSLHGEIANHQNQNQSLLEAALLLVEAALLL